MSTVTMRHSQLPDGQVIKVAEISVPHHRAAGWQVVDDKPAPAVEPPAPAAPPAVEDGDTTAPVAPKRRRTQKEDDR